MSRSLTDVKQSGSSDLAKPIKGAVNDPHPGPNKTWTIKNAVTNASDSSGNHAQKIPGTVSCPQDY